MNVIIHSLLHIPPLRDYLLLSNFHGKESELLKRFAGLAKKVWNPRLFKSQVSPHEFLQEVNRASMGKFRLEQQGDPVEFLGWLLNRLHKDMGGTKKRNSSA
jgi:U4/U6.U5 tri-snRNP-associated protein 2